MAITLKEAKKEYGISPKHHYRELDYYLDRMRGKEVKSSRLHSLAGKLAGMAEPTYKDEFDTKWVNFYFPMRRSGRLIAVPLAMMKYGGDYWIFLFGSGSLAVRRGKERAERIYEDIFRETIGFIPVIKKTGNRILEKAVPYDLRSGRVKGKYLMERSILPKRRRADILKRYGEHIGNGKRISAVSLDEYLRVCALCYKAAYGKKTAGMSPREMYWKWADKRHGGMLDIKDGATREEYSKWYNGHAWGGSHPFEIVFSWHGHGIELYPPSRDKPYYTIWVDNHAHATAFVKMVEALIECGVPFEARELENVLDYLAGETYFTVNEYKEHMFHYIPSEEYKRRYFHKIEWEKPKAPRWI